MATIIQKLDRKIVAQEKEFFQFIKNFENKNQPRLKY